MKATGADLGVAHDGDADRIGAVDDRGNYVGMDQLLAVVAAAQVKEGSKRIVTTVDASRVVDDAVEEAGGEVLRTKVGDVAVAQEILKTGAVFGGEPSGSWIFSNIHLAPDGPLAALELVELLEKSEKKLSELVADLPKYFTSREKIPCPEKKKKKAMDKLSKLVSVEIGGKLTTVDGVRADLESGWVLIRPSGTEPYIRVTAEGKTKSDVQNLMKKSLKLVRNAVKG